MAGAGGGEKLGARPLTSGRRAFALAAVCAVLFLTFLDTTIVSVALASVQADLHAGVTQLQWVVNGYALTFASFMMVAGTLGDRFGRKRVMITGLGIFAAGSVMGALATNPDVLIAARVIMGVGAAASEPGTLSVIRHLYPDGADRARALGAWAAVSGLALALGPVIGGTLVGVGGWSAVFWFNVAAAVVFIAMAAKGVPESSDPEQVPLDVRGFVTGAAGLAALTFAIILGETDGYGAAHVVALFVGGAVLLGAFAWCELRARSPMLDLRYLRSGPFSVSLTVVFVLFFGIFSIFFFTALYLYEVAGFSGYRVALEFVPMTAGIIGAAALAGRRVATGGPRLPMTLGCALAGAGVVLTELLLTGGRPSPWLMATLAMAGVGFGASVVPVTAVALETVPARHSGMAASATNTSRELGAVFGVAVLGSVVNAHLTSDLVARLRHLGVPSNLFSLIVNGVETGQVPSGVDNASSEYAKVINAAYDAFRSGLDVALLASGAGMLAAAVLAALTLGRAGVPALDVHGPPPGTPSL
jgi:EmrB/QacA subfamily drug resistance transporter